MSRKGQRTDVPLVAFVFVVWAGGIALIMPASEGQFGAVVAATGMLVMGWASLLAGTLQEALYRSTELYGLQHFPISDSDCFRYLWGKHVRKTWLLAVLLLMAYLSVGLNVKPGFDTALVAIGFALLEWVGALSLVLIAYDTRPFWPWKRIAFGFFAALVALFFFRDDLGKGPSHLSPLLYLTPSGWSWQACLHGYLKGNAWGWFALIVPLGLAFSLSVFIARVRRFYFLDELDLALPPGAEQVLNDAIEKAADWKANRAQEEALMSGSQGDSAIVESLKDDPELRAVQRDDIRREIRANMEEWIREREFLAPFDWGTLDPVARIAVRTLSSSERRIAPYMLAGGMNWTKRLKISLGILLVGTLAVLLCGKVVPQHVLWGAIALSALFGLPLAGGSLNAFIPAVQGQSWPLFFAFPIKYRDLIGLILKVNGIRCVLWIICAMPLTLFADWRSPYPWSAFWITSGFGSLVLLAQPIVFALRLSEWQRLRWTVWILAPMLLLGFLPVIVVLIGSVAMLEEAVGWLFMGGVCVAITSLATFLFCILNYKFARFDMLKKHSVN